MGPAYYNENDAFAAAWLRNLIREGLIAPGDVDERDIQAVEPADLVGYQQCHFFAGIGGWSLALRLAGWPDDRPVWTGSCPCQPFSGAGKGEGFNDPRHLWPTWFRLIRECRPAVIFGEQVASKAGLGWFDHVSADLEAAAYAIGAADLPAACVEAPHGRPRLFFVGQCARPDSNGSAPNRRTVGVPVGRERSAANHEAISHARGTIWATEPKPPAVAHGVSGRVGKCSGYGNAIVPQVASEFIAAWREAAGEYV